VPSVTRSRTVAASPQQLWDVIADPANFPRWWPDVVRVEDATPLAWTLVLATPKGATVRADFTRTSASEPRAIAWQQEIEESPFERILGENITDVELTPDGPGTKVKLHARQKLRGYSRFGGFLFRRATRRKLDAALDGLEGMVRSE
jgi:uncharacterized protein YndB with AHSA1/START domain